MARVTVEDCIKIVPNRYELVLLAAQRARDIAAGASLTLPRDNDKNGVVALREIAEQTISLNQLRRHIAQGVNRHADTNAEDEVLAALAELGPTVDTANHAPAYEEVSFGHDDTDADTDDEAAVESDEAEAGVLSDVDDDNLTDLPSAAEIAADLADLETEPEIDIADENEDKAKVG